MQQQQQQLLSQEKKHCKQQQSNSEKKQATAKRNRSKTKTATNKHQQKSKRRTSRIERDIDNGGNYGKEGKNSTLKTAFLSTYDASPNTDRKGPTSTFWGTQNLNNTMGSLSRNPRCLPSRLRKNHAQHTQPEEPTLVGVRDPRKQDMQRDWVLDNWHNLKETRRMGESSKGA